MTETDTKKQCRYAYWPTLPAAFALAGVVVFIFATFGPPASSSGFVSTVEGLLEPFMPEYVANNAHYQLIPGPGSWLMSFVVGMAGGGFVAGRTWGHKVRDIPLIWEERFGPSKVKRYSATFVSGFLILFASRLAGGCTLGLFISGTTQLAVSGIYFGLIIFPVAMLTAKLVYAQPKGEE